MLLTPLLHPQILSALGRAGHGSRVLVADANFPHGLPVQGRPARVFLNLCPGVVTAPQVLAALVETIPIEAAALMLAQDDQSLPVHSEIQALLPESVAVRGVSKPDFYALVRAPETALIVATGEERRFANVLVTVGVRAAGSTGQPLAPVRSLGALGDAPGEERS